MMMLPVFTVDELEGSTEVDESGTTDTFTVVLDAQPTSDVVLTSRLFPVTQVKQQSIAH